MMQLIGGKSVENKYVTIPVSLQVRLSTAIASSSA
jgi:hypothetical protein